MAVMIVAQNDSHVIIAAMRVTLVLVPDRVRHGYVLGVRLRIWLRVRLWIWQWQWIRVRLRMRYRIDLRRIVWLRPVRWRIAVSVRRVPGWAPWVHRRVWVVEIRSSCHDAIIGAAADVAVVGTAVRIAVVVAVVGLVIE